MTIKNLPAETRDLILQFSRRRSQMVSEWIANTVDRQAAIERGDLIEAPSSPARKLEVSPGRSAGETPFSDVAEIFAAAAQLAQTKGLPTKFRKLANDMMFERLERLRGFAPGEPEPLNGHPILPSV